MNYKQLVKYAKEHYNADVTQSDFSPYDGGRTIYIDAPDGFMWDEGQFTLTDMVWKCQPESEKQQVYQSLIDRMSQGLIEQTEEN